MSSEFRHNLALWVIVKKWREARPIKDEEDEIRLRTLAYGAILFIAIPLLAVPTLYLCFGWCDAMAVIIAISVANWFWIVPMALRFFFLFLRDLFEYLATNFPGIPFSEFDFQSIKGRKYFEEMFGMED